jgi:hypothetical protein
MSSLIQTYGVFTLTVDIDRGLEDTYTYCRSINTLSRIDYLLTDTRTA